MSKLSIVALSLLTAVGCGSSGPGGDDTGDDAPPFFDGVSTLTGHSDPGFVDGPRGKARLANPVNVAFGPDGKLYVADFDNGKIRQVDPESGQTSTVVAQDNFRRPFGLAFQGNTLFVCTDRDSMGKQDSTTGTIWRVSITGKSADVVAEKVGRCRGLAALKDGRIAFADFQSHTINVVDPANGAVSLLAGQKGAAGFADGVGAAARFNEPYHMVQRPDGSLIVTDYGNHRLRVVGLDGTVTTYAGAGTAGYGDGDMGAAKFTNPQGLAIASNGDLFVTDANNYRLRRISGSSVSTVAFSGEGGYLDHDDRMQAQIYGLEGLAVRPDGKAAYIADGGRGEDVPHNFIRVVKF